MKSTTDFPGTEELDRSKTWEEPEPLNAPDDPLPYPLGGLPGEIRETAKEVQAFTQAPPAMVASCALSALSLAGQGLANIRRDEGLTGPTGLFFLTLADSGERKSTVDRFFTETFQEKEREAKETSAPIVKEYMAAKASWEAEKSGILAKIQHLTKNGDDSKEWKEKLVNVEKVEPEAPLVLRLLYQDATPEALAWGLAHQWPSGGILSSEAGIVFGGHAMGKDSIVRNLSLLNQLWDGSPIHIDRRTAPSYTLEGVRLTVGLATQPATLTTFFDQSKGLARGTGFMARFLICWPESTQGTRLYKDAPASWPNLERFRDRLSKLIEDTPEPDPDKGLSPKMLTFDREGRKAWIDAHNEIEKDLGNKGDLRELRDIASKAADNIARLAALFALYRGKEQVAGEDIEGASLIVTWHLYEARRIFRTLAVSEDKILAGKLDAWLLRQGKSEIQKNDILQSGPNPLRKKARAEMALDILQGHNRIKLAKRDGKEVVRINPALLEGGQ